jgi:hypothetical protein
MKLQWQPVAAVTGSRLLRAELHLVEQHAGWDFEYTPSIPYARRFAHHQPMIIIGADLVGRVRKPLVCGDIVLAAATDDTTDRRIFTHAARIGIAYIAFLPTSSPWLIDLLLQSHRWCGIPAPHPAEHPQPPAEAGQ